MNQNKSAKWILIGAGLLGIAGLAIYGSREARKAQVAYDVLDTQFKAADTLEQPSPASDFSVLLDSKFGNAHLQQLDNDHETIAFHEDRQTVYYLHSRLGTSRSCIGTVSASGHGHLSGHSGASRQYEFTSVSVDGDVLSIDCRASNKTEHEQLVRSAGLIPGQVVTRSVSVRDTTDHGLTVELLNLPSPMSSTNNLSVRSPSKTSHH